MQPTSLYSSKYLDHFESTIERLLHATNNLLTEFHGASSSYEVKFLLDIVERIRLNYKAVHKLIPDFTIDNTFKFPISLVLRAVATDTLTVFYLECFASHQPSFHNEIKILQKESIKSVLKVWDCAFQVNKELHYSRSYLPDEQLYEQKKNELLKNRSEFFNNEIPVNNEVLRWKSDPNLLLKSNLKMTLNESNKFELILKSHPDFSLIYVYYRILSQYEHVSPASKSMLLQSESQDVLWWIQISQLATIAIQLCIGMVDPNKTKHLRELESIQSEFDKLPY